MQTPSIFISYSHMDKEWLDRLVRHLGVMQHQDLLDIWTDRRIDAGGRWYQEIQDAMARAKVAVLLVTSAFLSSSFIRTEEVPRLLQRREKEGLNVVPIIVEPCAWDLAPWLKQMQVRPEGAHAVSTGQQSEIDQILADITHEIYQMLIKDRGTPGSVIEPELRELKADECLPKESVINPPAIGITLIDEAWNLAHIWFTSVRSGDFEHVWSLSEHNWRLCRAQAWIWNNRTLLGLDDLRAAQQMALALSEVDSLHPLWPEFARSERNQFLEWFAGAPTEEWGVASRRRPVGPGYELLIFMPRGNRPQGYLFTQPTVIPGWAVLTHLTTDGWRVAAFGAEAAPQPGWPPTWWIRHDPVAAAVTDEMLLLSRNSSTHEGNERTSASDTLYLAAGCNNVSPTVSESAAAFAARIVPAAALVSIQEHQATADTYRIFSPMPGATNDLAHITRLRPVFICVSAPAVLYQPPG